MTRTAAYLAFCMATTLFATQPPTGSHPLPAVLARREMVRQTCRLIAPGVEHRSTRFKDPFGDGPVNVNLLVVHWREVPKDFSLGLAFCGGVRKRPTEMGEAPGALAVVYGGYHETTDPTRPFSPVKIDGAVLSSQHPGGDTALAFNKGQMPVIASFLQALLEQYENVTPGDGISAFQHDPTGKVGRAPHTLT